MKFKIKLYRGEIFATPIINMPFALNPNGYVFSYNGKTYKIIDAVFIGYDEGIQLSNNTTPNDEYLPILTVVEIPNI